MEITKDIVYLGVNDHAVDLFESQYSVPNGMAYNSYLIMDDQTVVMDTVDAHFTDEWITKIAAALGERAPDYLVVQHMEPDHAGSIDAFAQAYPTTKIVSSAKAFVMMQQFFGTDYADRRVVVKEGDTLPLGHHTLHFVTAPMVHWPEVIMTYDDADKVLFSADAFGKFGALDVEEEWLPEARRYFIGIVGKYGVQVQAVLKKAAGLDIETICSLHGPILHKEQLADVLAAYDTWSAYRPETDGILVAYTSIYGHTADAAEQLAEELRTKGQQVVVMDLARCDMAEAVAQAFRFSKLVLATPTYNGDVFPFTKTFIEHLTERNYQNRTVALMENGSWAPTAARVMRKMFEASKNLTILDETVTVKGSLDDASTAQLHALADALSK
ncbi:FprA family A-type flavoprotein [uncultured Gemmiger sp.]|uniref:FprA family A-type flavoprotein n=1 Tax=uncultured Gemmiger sp. TaxID=1623490 RepID=UPI0025F8DB8C|nr:FprA family A-type flavoprotein [uncultured Gemmiger sp.]